MTYFLYLLLFLGLPLVVMGFLTWRDARRGIPFPQDLTSFTPGWVILAHIIVAVIYTTPWDNYLVATGVWWYDPQLVTGITLGWVPIEEYTFFILQTLLTGLWLVWLARRMQIPASPVPKSPRLRWLTLVGGGFIWMVFVLILLQGPIQATYMGLELVWALPPILLQLGFGADILWHYRRLVITVILPMTLYLAATDALAISAGTWTIDPAQSLNVLLAGILPVEEFLFFLLTNTLVTFGMILVLALESKKRVPLLREKSSPGTASL